MTAQTARLLVDGNGQVIPNQYYDSTTDSYVVGSATNGTPFHIQQQRLHHEAVLLRQAQLHKH